MMTRPSHGRMRVKLCSLHQHASVPTPNTTAYNAQTPASSPSPRTPAHTAAISIAALAAAQLL
eukprot:3713734-Rhodomonas_salina.1